MSKFQGLTCVQDFHNGIVETQFKIDDNVASVKGVVKINSIEITEIVAIHGQYGLTDLLCLLLRVKILRLLNWPLTLHFHQGL